MQNLIRAGTSGSDNNGRRAGEWSFGSALFCNRNHPLPEKELKIAFRAFCRPSIVRGKNRLICSFAIGGADVSNDCIRVAMTHAMFSL